MLFSQGAFEVRCEWGNHGVATLAPGSDAVVIVDVLCFSTAVSVAVSRGARVYPYRYKDASAAEHARSLAAECAGARGKACYSLSPLSLDGIPRGRRLVLPLPNGSTLSLGTGEIPTFAGCLRNAKAVVQAAGRCGKRVAVIPAGERWTDDGSLRPAFEDLVGAGAVISGLAGSRSPEARVAVAAYEAARSGLLAAFRQCGSGKQLIAGGYGCDLEWAAKTDVDRCAPRLVDGAYTDAGLAV